MQVFSQGLRWNSLLQVKLLWMESTGTELSRPFDYVWQSRFTSTVDERMIGVVLLPKRRGDLNGSWRGTCFRNDIACWARY